MHPQVADIGAVYKYPSPRGVVEARYEVGEGRFAGTRLSYERHGGPRRYLEVDVAEHVGVAVVAEIHIVEAYAGAACGQRLGRGGVGDWVAGIEYLVDTLHRRQSLLYRIYGFGEVLGRVYDAVEDYHIVDKLRGVEGGVAAEYEAAAEP